MKDYDVISNNYFEIIISNKLKVYGKEVLDYSTNKIKEYFKFFNAKTYGNKIKAAFMINHDDFIQRIKDVQPTIKKVLPPDWATGCFYGGECQILLTDNPYNNYNTLAHETFHLLFSKFIYEKNNWDRIVWLDESLAGNFDGTTEKLIVNGNFQDLIKKLTNNKDLPKMCDLNFEKGNIKTNNYNGYDLFKVVGRYLIETKKDNLLNYVNDLSQIKKDGENILVESIEYFSNKYNNQIT